MADGCLTSLTGTVDRNLLIGKTEDQKKAIEYFCKQEGCLSKIITDAEYEAMVLAKKESLNLKKVALNKIGLDEDQVNEISPALFEGYVFEKAYSKKIPNGNWVSSAYQVSWIFFSSTQIYFYRHTFYMDSDKKTEGTDEFFYKDITSFSTSSIAETTSMGFEVETNKFSMVVPGEKIAVSMDGVSNAEEIIQAMKQKLREKKQ